MTLNKRAYLVHMATYLTGITTGNGMVIIWFMGAPCFKDPFRALGDVEAHASCNHKASGLQGLILQRSRPHDRGT